LLLRKNCAAARIFPETIFVMPENGRFGIRAIRRSLATKPGGIRPMAKHAVLQDLVECRPIRLQYFVRIPNIGDLINPIIVSAITGEQTVRASSDAPHLLAIGSLMAGATPQSCVWGTGVMHPDIGIGSPEASRIHAVRGKLSHTALRQAAIAVVDVPLGDPGILAPAIFGVERSPAPKHRLGVVPHYVDRASPFFPASAV
jgi:hypothetical protein